MRAESKDPESGSKMEPHKKDLIDFLKAGNGFIIPPFQRRHEWDEKQCEILYDDIFKTAHQFQARAQTGKIYPFFWDFHSKF